MPTLPDRIRLLVLFGGQSAEHDVSCMTAAHVLAAANPDRYELVPIGIDRDGKWNQATEARDILAEKSGLQPQLPETLSPVGAPTNLDRELAAADALQVAWSASRLSVVLPLLHGPMGEDGTVQGLLELAGVPYVGAGVLGSALAMDKAKAKEVLASAGIPQARWLSFNEQQWLSDDDPARLDKLAAELGFPCFVKPANMGSSVGVSKCTDSNELQAGIDLAFSYDEWIVIEEGVAGREIELAVLGNHEPEVSVAGEVVPADDFYSYDDKYINGISSSQIPAVLPAGMQDKLQRLAIEAYQALRVEGMARADFFVTNNGTTPLLNELNTIPGFTPISMYPKLWEASGLSYSDLIDRLVDLAIERHQRRSAKRITHH